MKIYYKSKIAKWLTFIEGFGTIMLFGAVFTEKESLPERVIEHEKVHDGQYSDCFGIGLILMSFFIGIVGWSWWLLAALPIPIFLFYVIYLVECLISLVVNFVRYLYAKYSRSVMIVDWYDKPYRNSAFEQQAKALENEYLKPAKERKRYKPFGWIRFYGKI
ncbi:hypothetical protein LJC39_01890 [Parabacteroides sp. OttesenSCG-928-B22]|nr:hypothetical protein [Parabacteroides sp. OttesenSCG-928-B22]